MMFEPNFSYTNKIVRNLTFTADARAIILNAPLIPKWEVSLRRDALLRSAHASTAIEGNPLSFEEVSALAAGRAGRSLCTSVRGFTIRFMIGFTIRVWMSSRVMIPLVE